MSDQLAALDAIRAELPWWFGFAPLAFVPFAAMLALVGSHLAVSVALLAHRRVAPDAHWTELARRAWAARATASGAPLLCAILLGIAAGALQGPLSLVPGGVLGLLAGVAAFVAAYPQIGRVERIVRKRALPMRERVAGQTFAFLTLFPHLLIVLIGGALMPAEPLPAIAVGTLLFVLLLAVAAGAGLRACVALGLARPADGRLRAIVDACSEKVGVRAKHVWIVRWPMVNALAFPRTGELAFTEQAAAELSDEHLEAITAHELGHLGEPRAIVLSRSIALFALLPIALIRPILRNAGDGDWVLGGIVALGAVLIGYALALIAQRVARRMEERADAIAHAHEGDPGTYARALERIYELNLVPAVLGTKRPVHPHLYDRLVAAGVTPDHPRPAPPPRAAHVLASLTLIATLAGGTLAWNVGLMSSSDPEAPSIVSIALRGGPTGDLAEIGYARWLRGDVAGAIPYYRALTALEPESAYWPSELARMAAWSGLCEEARGAFEEAVLRSVMHDPYGADLLPEVRASVDACVPP